MRDTKNLLCASVSLILLISAYNFIIASGAYGQPNKPPSPVEVVNSPTVELAPGTEVRDANNPAFQPVSGSVIFNLSDGDPQATETAVEVPSGKRLVIEFVSVSGSFPIGQLTPDIRIFTDTFNIPSGTVQVGHHIDAGQATLSPSGMRDTYRASHSLRLYVLSGDDVTVFLGRGSPNSGEAEFVVTWSGYLVDVP